VLATPFGVEPLALASTAEDKLDTGGIGPFSLASRVENKRTAGHLSVGVNP
jgi:hypothetical protein